MKIFSVIGFTVRGTVIYAKECSFKFYSTEKVARVNLVTFLPYYADIVRTVVTRHINTDDGIKIIYLL